MESPLGTDAKQIEYAHTERMDDDDPLQDFKCEFKLPKGVYLDGNSLGALPRKTIAVLEEVVREQWGNDLIASWNLHDWVSMPQRVGAKIAKLLGAEATEVIACDSTSVNLFKVVSAALDLRPDRLDIISEQGNFPTDLYMLEGLTKIRGGKSKITLLEDPRDLLKDSMDLSSIAVVVLTHVNFRTGRKLDMKAITAAVHKKGALIVWDLAHSAGAVPVALNDAGADYAVGCGYKFLNGGPGAPSFLYVAERHQAHAENPLSGWFGHKSAFAFHSSYQPADGITRFMCGTPPILGLAALEVGVDVMLKADMQQVAQKSLQLCRLFLDLLNQECRGFGFRLPPHLVEKEQGSQVSIGHAQGYAIVQALAKRGVIGDFRSPDLIRLGFTPLYTRYTDIWNAVQDLKLVMEQEEWRSPEFQKRNAVT